MKAQMEPQDPDVDTAISDTEDDVGEAMSDIRDILSRLDHFQWIECFPSNLPLGQKCFYCEVNIDDPDLPKIKKWVAKVQKLNKEIQPKLKEQIRSTSRGYIFDLEETMLVDLDSIEGPTEDISKTKLRRLCARGLGARHYSEVGLVLCNDEYFLPFPESGNLQSLGAIPSLVFLNLNKFSVELHKIMIPSSLTLKIQAFLRETKDALGDKLRQLNSEEWRQDIEEGITIGDAEMIRRMWPAVRPEDHANVLKTLRRALAGVLCSCYGRFPETCRTVLADLVKVCGVDIGRTSETRQTLLHEIARGQKYSLSTEDTLSLVRELKLYGLNIFAVDEMGMSALHFAVDSCDMVRGLLLCGLDKDQKNFDSKRPLDFFNELCFQNDIPFYAEIEKLLKGENSHRASLTVRMMRWSFRILSRGLCFS